MTEEFKKGLATGMAIGGVTVVKPPLYGIQIGDYEHQKEIELIYSGSVLVTPSILTGEYIAQPTMAYSVDGLNGTTPLLKTGDLIQ